MCRIRRTIFPILSTDASAESIYRHFNILLAGRNNGRPDHRLDDYILSKWSSLSSRNLRGTGHCTVSLSGCDNIGRTTIKVCLMFRRFIPKLCGAAQRIIVDMAATRGIAAAW